MAYPGVEDRRAGCVRLAPLAAPDQIGGIPRARRKLLCPLRPGAPLASQLGVPAREKKTKPEGPAKNGKLGIDAGGNAVRWAHTPPGTDEAC